MANMDEFGMGSFNRYGFGGKPVSNPIDPAYFPGGSSGGSAAAVRDYQALGALGTDTGGSINYPAHCCGLFSMKPSFGRISRFGQILYSSSNETTGPFGHSIDDIYSLFHTMQGADQNDSNSIDFSKLNKIRYPDRVLKPGVDAPDLLKGLRVGIVDEFNIKELDDRNRLVQSQFIDMLKDRGAIVKRMSVPLLKHCLPMYYSIIPSEAATNLSRFDGIKYGHQPEMAQDEELLEYITRVRSEALGINVKRRITLGNFLLSSKFEDFNEKIRAAQKIRRMLIA